jgi:alpha-L-fucosidase
MKRVLVLMTLCTLGPTAPAGAQNAFEQKPPPASAPAGKDPAAAGQNTAPPESPAVRVMRALGSRARLLRVGDGGVPPEPASATPAAAPPAGAGPRAPGAPPVRGARIRATNPFSRQPAGQGVPQEHAALAVEAIKDSDLVHTTHPGAQWFPQAGLGLFIHWGIASVRAMNISWPMFDRGTGTGAAITPNEYWTQAKDFNPKKYDPDKWLRAAKKAGFTYAVLTARHHEGFALWPSAFGDFNTKNFMGGRDLIKPYVEACRRAGLKVGLYYSPPDWYFERDFMSFSRRPGAPPIGPDGKPRTTKKSAEEEAIHKAAYAAMVRGQIEELLTRYGKIDLLWFDGKPRGLKGDEIMTLERIRELQPAIVVNPRLHNRGDYRTFERRLPIDKPVKTWAEFCDTWTNNWPHVADAPFRAPGYVLGNFAAARALGVNFLLGVGPTADGEFVEDIYKNMTVLGDWLRRNGAAVRDTTPLPAGESASVPATAARQARYLFALPAFKPDGRFEKDLLPPADTTLRLAGVSRPVSVQLMRDGRALEHQWADNVLTIDLPAARRSQSVDVIKVAIKPDRTAAALPNRAP